MFFKRKKEQKSPVLAYWQWILSNAKQITPSRFEKDSHTKDDRIRKFEAIAVSASYAFWQMNKDAEVNAKAQDLYDHMFDQFEIAMREQGVSDVRIGPEVRKFSSAFDGRRVNYTEAFDGKDLKNLEKSLLNNEPWTDEELKSILSWSEQACNTKLEDWLKQTHG